MTYDPEQAVTRCDTPGCRFRLYSMGESAAERWARYGGTVVDGRHACPRHGTTPPDTSITNQKEHDMTFDTRIITQPARRTYAQIRKEAADNADASANRAAIREGSDRVTVSAYKSALVEAHRELLEAEDAIARARAGLPWRDEHPA